MAKIEHGNAKLLSVDTEKKVLRFQEIIRGTRLRGQQPQQYEYPYLLDLTTEDFYIFVGKAVDYVLSDGVVVDLKLG